MFDPDGYYRTGDIMAEVGPDQLVYLDRRNNVLKLSQGEFVTVSKLEAVFGDSPLVRQIYVYGNSARSYLLAVVVPTDGCTVRAHDVASLKPLISRVAAECREGGRPAVLRDPARLHHRDNAVHAGERPADRHPQAGAAEAEGALRRSSGTALHRAGRQSGQRAARAAPQRRRPAGAGDRQPGRRRPAGRGADRSGARRALHRPGRRFAVRVDVRQSAARDLRHRRAGRRHRQPGHRPAGLADYIEAAADIRREAARRSRRCTAATPPRCTPVTSRWTSSSTRRRWPPRRRCRGPSAEVRTVLLTGATGFLGRYLALEWLERMDLVGGKADLPGARQGRRRGPATAGQDLRQRRSRSCCGTTGNWPPIIWRSSPATRAKPNLGLDQQTWQRLADTVDLIVDPAALVNHVLPYSQLFGPNVAGHRRADPHRAHHEAEAVHLRVDHRRRRPDRTVGVHRGRRHPGHQPDPRDRRQLRQRLRQQQVGRRGAAARGPRPVRPAGRGVPLRHDPGRHRHTRVSSTCQTCSPG